MILYHSPNPTKNLVDEKLLWFRDKGRLAIASLIEQIICKGAYNWWVGTKDTDMFEAKFSIFKEAYNYDINK